MISTFTTSGNDNPLVQFLLDPEGQKDKMNDKNFIESLRQKASQEEVNKFSTFRYVESTDSWFSANF